MQGTFCDLFIERPSQNVAVQIQLTIMSDLLLYELTYRQNFALIQFQFALTKFKFAQQNLTHYSCSHNISSTQQRKLYPIP